MKKKKIPVFFNEMAAILDFMILSKEHIYNFKTALSNAEQLYTHVEDVYIKEYTQETHRILCVLNSFGAPLNRCSGKDILLKSG